MAIELEDALSEAYKLNPIEYRWKKYEKEAPKMDEDFKWNFLSEIKQPQMEIKGPSVGSLLYALNPQTSELGLKQMESELNQELKANEMFDKRGEEALKFMENRVQEDIEKKKMQNVDAGHFNSLMGNLTQAYATNSPSLPVIIDQVKRTIPNAETFIAEAQKNAETAKAQTTLFNKYDSTLPRGTMWKNNAEREAWIKTVEGDKGLSEDLKSKLKKEANSINTLQNFRWNKKAENKVSKDIDEDNQVEFNTKVSELMKKKGWTRTQAENFLKKGASK